MYAIELQNEDGRRKRRRRSSPPSQNPELSEEIIVEVILVRLPVKSLVRFKSVYKAWRATISDPIFIHAHLRHSATKREQDPSTLIYTKDLGGGEAISQLGYLVFCDGLVLARTDTKLYLFNPATRDSLTLPDSKRNNLA
ncbi:unnamed protein product [Miscanthus lutarioriparius]|uniref:F-box domain-containing protein n=1 Tax=Miscanthus lutarioriparius TaxID=422564 RepID=A0A811RN68_9POAL|nr:unnamed protein product [Miscanthus lutarioriparius]